MPRSSRRTSAVLLAVLLPVVSSLTLLVGTTGTASGAVNPDPDLISVYEPCEPDTGVTVIVDFQSLGDNDVQVRCALGEQRSGWHALLNAGFTLAGTTQFPDFVCRINNLPTPEQTNCFSAPLPYWSYWHAQPGGRWGYSSVGAGGYKPKIGSVEGWAYSKKVNDTVPEFRVQPQDSRGAIFVLPDTYPSSASQVTDAQRWLVEHLPGVIDGSVPVIGGGGGERRQTVLAEMIDSLARSGYDMSSSDLDVARDYYRGLATGSGELDLAQPLPERIADVALAYGLLNGGEPILSNGTNLRDTLIDLIEPGTASVRRHSGTSTSLGHIAPVVEALARTGGVPAEAAGLVDAIKTAPATSTGWGGSTTAPQLVIRALAPARASGVTGLDDAVEESALVIESLQADDGSIQECPPCNVQTYPPIAEETAEASVALSLAGHTEPAERAARFVSRHQVTAELAGGGPDAEFPGPASADVGAFLPNTDLLRDAIQNGVHPATGLQTTRDAVAALALAPWEDPIPPTLLTTAPKGLAKTGVTITGSIEPGSSSQHIHVEYGPTTAYGQRVEGPSVAAYAETSWFDLPITGLTPETTYHYRLAATDDSGQATYGEDQTFTTLPDDTAPVIGTDVANVSAVEGADATFTVAANGKPVPTVTWQTQGTNGWQDIVSDSQFIATGTSLTIKELTLSQSGQRYRAKAVNRAGSTYSRSATLTVTPKPADPDPTPDPDPVVGTSVTSSAGPVKYGQAGQVTVAVVAASGSVKPTGTVSTKVGSRTITAALSNGSATLTLPVKSLKPGTRSLTVTYSGAGNQFTGSSSTVSVKVVKASPKVKVKGPKKVKRGKTAKFTITVTAPGVKPGGKVTVKVAGKSKTVKLNAKGKAVVKVKIAKKTKPGKKTVTVTYKGNTYVANGKAKVAKTTVTK